jgi:Ca2+/Na+ antiporter
MLGFMGIALVIFDIDTQSLTINVQLWSLVLVTTLPMITVMIIVLTVVIVTVTFFILSFLMGIINCLGILAYTLIIAYRRWKRKREYVSFHDSLETRTFEETQNDQQTCPICLEDFAKDT